MGRRRSEIKPPKRYVHVSCSVLFACSTEYDPSLQFTVYELQSSSTEVQLESYVLRSRKGVMCQSRHSSQRPAGEQGGRGMAVGRGLAPPHPSLNVSHL